MDTNNSKAEKTIAETQKKIKDLQAVAPTLISVGALSPAQVTALGELSKLNESLLKTMKDLTENGEEQE